MQTAPSRIPLLASALLSLAPAILSQDPGFFLDEWQEKNARIPQYTEAYKPLDSATVRIQVDMEQALNRVPPYIYGNNAVMWNGSLLDNSTVMTDIRNLNPRVLRWPGGSNSDLYFWNVPYGQRPADIPQEINPDNASVWYGSNTPNWQMSTDEYYHLQDWSSSKGIIVVNYAYARYGTGPDPVARAAHMAAEWVRYDKGRSRFWEIGNENYGNWEAGYRIDTSLNQDGQPEFISGQLYGQHCRVFMDSMRAAASETGADIRIGVVAYDAETGSDPIWTDWNEEMMQEVGDLADFLVVHSYFTPWRQNSDAITVLNSHDVPGKIMSVLAGDMAEAGKPMLPVAMTEWNIFAEGSMQQVSFVNGMLAALVLGEFVQNGYGLGTRWDLVNGWNDGNDHGTFSVGGEPGVDLFNPRPVFFYMYYFQEYFGDQMVGSTVAGNGDVIAYASSFASGEGGLVIINKSLTAETVSVEMDHFKSGIRYYTHTLTGGTDNGEFSRKVFLNGTGTDEEGGGPDEYASVKAFAFPVEGGIKVDLPPRSVVYLMVEKKPPLSYVSSRIDTNASVITVQLTDTVILPEDPSGFTVTANGSTAIAVTAIGADPQDVRQIHLFLERGVIEDEVITLSYSGSGILAPDSTSLVHFSDETVDIFLPWALNEVMYRVKNTASGLPVGDCPVTFNGETRSTDSTGEVTFLAADGQFLASAAKKHLEPILNQVYTIMSDTVITLFMDSLEYQVDFHLEDIGNGADLPDVEISVGGRVRETDASGRASFALPAGGYPVQFALQNYHTEKSDFQIESDTLFTVELERSHATVKFRLRSGLQPVTGAMVVLGEDSLITNPVGVCTFESVPLADELEYRAARENYYPVQGSLVVKTDTTLDLQMEKSVANLAFRISSPSALIENACAILAQDTAWFTVEGSCTFYGIAIGQEHTYRIISDNFPDYTGSVFLERDTTIEISLTAVSGLLGEGDTGFRVYPNPAKDRITIAGPLHLAGSLEILDFAGKKVWYGKLDAGLSSISLAISLSPGVYILKISTPEGVDCTRLIIPGR